MGQDLRTHPAICASGLIISDVEFHYVMRIDEVNVPSNAAHPWCASAFCEPWTQLLQSGLLGRRESDVSDQIPEVRIHVQSVPVRIHLQEKGRDRPVGAGFP